MFADKKLYFAKISFWDFCEIFCEKLTKIGAKFSQIWSFFTKSRFKFSKVRFKFLKIGFSLKENRLFF